MAKESENLTLADRKVDPVERQGLVIAVGYGLQLDDWFASAYAGAPLTSVASARVSVR